SPVSPKLLFTAIDGGGAGNGIAVAIDYPADPNRFNVTVTGAPDVNGNSTVEQFNGLSMNLNDPRSVERAINGKSNLVTVKRTVTPAGKGSSTSNPAAAPALTPGQSQIRVAVDGNAPVTINLTTFANIVTDIGNALGAGVTVSHPAGNANAVMIE